MLAKCLLAGPDLKNTETLMYGRKLSQEAASYAARKQPQFFHILGCCVLRIHSVGNYLELMFGGDFVHPVLVLGKLGL